MTSLVRYVGPCRALAGVCGLYAPPQLTIAGRVREVAPDDVEPAAIMLGAFECDTWSRALDLLSAQCGQVVDVSPDPAGLSIVVADKRYTIEVR